MLNAVKRHWIVNWSLAPGGMDVYALFLMVLPKLRAGYTEGKPQALVEESQAAGPGTQLQGINNKP